MAQKKDYIVFRYKMNFVNVFLFMRNNVDHFDNDVLLKNIVTDNFKSILILPDLKPQNKIFAIVGVAKYMSPQLFGVARR